jgi:hypothetical protein
VNDVVRNDFTAVAHSADWEYSEDGNRGSGERFERLHKGFFSLTTRTVDARG